MASSDTMKAENQTSKPMSVTHSHPPSHTASAAGSPSDGAALSEVSAESTSHGIHEKKKKGVTFSDEVTVHIPEERDDKVTEDDTSPMVIQVPRREKPEISSLEVGVGRSGYQNEFPDDDKDLSEEAFEKLRLKRFESSGEDYGESETGDGSSTCHFSLEIVYGPVPSGAPSGSQPSDKAPKHPSGVPPPTRIDYKRYPEKHIMHGLTSNRPRNLSSEEARARVSEFEKLDNFSDWDWEIDDWTGTGTYEGMRITEFMLPSKEPWPDGSCRYHRGFGMDTDVCGDIRAYLHKTYPSRLRDSADLDEAKEDNHEGLIEAGAEESDALEEKKDKEGITVLSEVTEEAGEATVKE